MGQVQLIGRFRSARWETVRIALGDLQLLVLLLEGMMSAQSLLSSFGTVDGLVLVARALKDFGF